MPNLNKLIEDFKRNLRFKKTAERVRLTDLGMAGNDCTIIFTERSTLDEKELDNKINNLIKNLFAEVQRLNEGGE